MLALVFKPAVAVFVADFDAVAFIVARPASVADATLLVIGVALMLERVDSVATAAFCPCFTPMASNDEVVANAVDATRDLLTDALNDDRVVNPADAVRLVIRSAVALITASVAKLAEPVLLLIFTAVAFTVASVAKLAVATRPRRIVALIVPSADRLAVAVLLLTFVATALIDALDAIDADATDDRAAMATTIDALACHPADANLVLAGGACNVDVEPMFALAVFDVPPVLEPKLTPNAPNLGPAPIACAGGNIPI